MPYVVGALGSRPMSKGFGRNPRGAPGGREPKGMRHAIDTETGDPACGTLDSLRTFDDLDWAPEGEWCEECEALVPFD